MPNSTDFVAYVLELARNFAPASARPMFGGHGIYAGGPIIGIVVDDILFLKTDATNRGEFTALGLEPFAYRTKDGERNETSYYRAPDEALESADAMRVWLRSAQEAAMRKASVAKKRSHSKPSRTAKPKRR